MSELKEDYMLIKCTSKIAKLDFAAVLWEFCCRELLTLILLLVILSKLGFVIDQLLEKGARI